MTPNRSSSSRSLACAIVLALLFIWLAIALSRGATQGLDSASRAYIHDRSSPELTTLMRGASKLGSLLFLIPAALIFGVISTRIGRSQAAVRMAWAFGGAIVLENILKYSFHRIYTATALLVGAIGLSRIYLGVHYPSDVLGGYLVAGFWLASLSSARQRK